MKNQALPYLLTFTLLVYAEIIYRFMDWRLNKWRFAVVRRPTPSTPGMFETAPRYEPIVGAGSVREYIQLHPWHSASCVVLLAALAGLLATIAEMKGLISVREKGPIWHCVCDEPAVVVGTVSGFRWIDTEGVAATTSFSAAFALCRRRPWLAT